MNAIRRILVAVKTPLGKTLPSVTKAAQLARAFDAELFLFTSIAPPRYLEGEVSYLSYGLAELERGTREACLNTLEVVARRLRRKRLKVSVSAEFDYPVYDAIIREARRVKADLIVAEQRHGHLAASLLHLTDWELLRLSPAPVLLVKQPRAYRRPIVLAAVDPNHAYAKPIWLDREILNAGSRIAAALGGRLHAVHAYDPVPLLAFPNGTISEDEVERLHQHSAQVAGRKLTRALRDAEVKPARTHLIGRHPSDAIPEVASATHSSLVVMGAISRSGFKRLLIGNTAERVLDRLACDVLIIKPAHLVRQLPERQRPVRAIQRAADQSL